MSATPLETAPPPPRASLTRRTSAFLHRHERTKLGILLGPTGIWILVFYLGALVVLLMTSFWSVDSLTGRVVHTWSLQNFQTLVREPVFRIIIFRTVLMAAATTIIDILLAFPVAYYAARLATPRTRNAILVAVVLPLWSSYLVRVFAWRTILQGRGPADWVLSNVFHLNSVRLGFTNWAVLITFCYLWLPFVILPIYAALERIPESLLEASSDMGAKGWTTFRRVVFPLALPGIVAGSIFAFSLTLGDYVAPELVGNTQFIGNAIHTFTGVAHNLPLAAALAVVPMLIMAVYLTVARRVGAFDAL